MIGLAMELYFFFSLVIVADAVILRFIPKRRRVVPFVYMSILFAVETVLIVALVGSPLHPVYRPEIYHEYSGSRF